MALNFPSNPAQGETYTANQVTWQFDGVAWTVIPSSGTILPNAYGIVTVNGTQLTATTTSDILNLLSGDNITLNSDTDTKTLTISATTSSVQSSNDIGLYIAADDSTQRFLSNGETIQFIGGTGIVTLSDEEGNITISSTASAGNFSTLVDSQTANLTIDKIYEQATMRFDVDNNGVAAYTFSHYTGDNPSIYVIAGTTVAFDLNAITGHPFEIQDSLGDPYNTGLIHVSTTGTVSTGTNAQGKDSGTLYWKIPENISGTYRYQCQLHVAMVGGIVIKRISLI